MPEGESQRSLADRDYHSMRRLTVDKLLLHPLQPCSQTRPIWLYVVITPASDDGSYNGLSLPGWARRRGRTHFP